MQQWADDDALPEEEEEEEEDEEEERFSYLKEVLVLPSSALCPWTFQRTALPWLQADPPRAPGCGVVQPFSRSCTRHRMVPRRTSHHGGNPGSISHRCHPILVAFVWELT